MDSYRNSDATPPVMVGSPPPAEWRIPRLNWDRPPWNRWAFQHIREMLPTAAIRRAARPSPLPETAGRLDDLTYSGADGQQTSFAEMLEETYTDAMLVWKDGQILHESYHNGMDAQTPHLLQSVSKSITAGASASLIEEGLLDPAAPITDYLPELARTAWNGATLQQVMDMTTGVRFDETYHHRDSDAGKMDVAAGWKLPPPDFDTSDWPRSIWDQILGLTIADAEHGARFHYRSIETDILAHAMQRVTGQPLARIISERLWQPLGCAEDASITIDSAGYGLACGGISATLRDMARFGIALLNDGQIDGRQVIPRAFVEDTRSGPHGLFDDYSRETLPNGCYRNQFWIEDAQRGRFMCRGVFGQMVYVATDARVVAVKFSTYPEFLSRPFFLSAMAAFHAVAGP
ncbi:MAG: 6-aminohexanoate hydrolase [Cereibacter sphaeroides]|uniref:6-aminohexanoate hydrolase n=1 Tax=Cereibacter sphaeroides TaxID=1063 RepID=A0A2W5S7P7_CERSP|nr:MAG: 6-aminohexanoate hydrolase [Cereibacter sphaeroides]